MDRSASLIIYDRLDYASAWQLQHKLVEDRLAGRRGDTLLLLEHNPVFTIGRSGKVSHYREIDASCQDRDHLHTGVPVFHVERGGSVTYHGPGQLVAYPILKLRSYCGGPRTYMRLLEEVVIRVLACWGIPAQRMDKLTGVWVHNGQTDRKNGQQQGHDASRDSQHEREQNSDMEKIAAMGVRIARGVTMHGFALNVSVDLNPFGSIVPCGISDCRVTSMARLLGRPADLGAVRAQTIEAFAEVFGLTWIHSETDGLPDPGVTRVPVSDLGSPATTTTASLGRRRSEITPQVPTQDPVAGGLL